MNCTEFQEFLPDVVEGVRNPDHEYHLKGCLDCMNLVSELEIILRDARQLEGMFEPGPQVWDNIETTLASGGADSSATVGARISFASTATMESPSG
jgi:hypothetical protein